MNMKKAMAICGATIILGQNWLRADDQNVNVTVNINNINQSQSYSPGSTAYSEPDEEHGYKIVSSHIYDFRRGNPIDVALPGVDGGFLRLIMKNLGETLCGGLMKDEARDENARPIVSAGQIAHDQPALPCLLCEWTYRAVDRDGSLLGILVTMVNPQLHVMRKPMRVMTPQGPRIVEEVQNVTMEPMLRVTIWRKQ